MREATERAVLRVAGAWVSVALVYLLSAEAIARVMVILLGYLPLCVVRMVMRVKRLKGIWWMPWRREAMKDVVRCEKPRGAANKL